MNRTIDPLQIVADLEPVVLSQLADDGYARRRHDDLTRAFAEGTRTSRRYRRQPQSRLAAARPGWPLLTAGGAVIAAAAVAAVAVAASVPGSLAPSRDSALSARGFLLASADTAIKAPASTGKYWYTRERDFEPTATHAKSLAFGASFAATEESWIGQNKARTVVNEKLVFSFASAADKAKWEAAGSPKLAGPAGFGSTGPVTSNYDIGFRWGVGKHQLTIAGLRQLPTTAATLGRLLHRMWMSPPDPARTLGIPSFSQFVFQWTDAVLTGPSSPATRAAMYQVLAGQRGITIVAKVIDPLGRPGNAIGDGIGDFLIIDPGTAQLLAYTTAPVHAHTEITGTGTEVYAAQGWTDLLGVPAS